MRPWVWQGVQPGGCLMFVCCLSYTKLATLLAIPKAFPKLPHPLVLVPKYIPLISSVWGCLWWWVLVGLIPRWSLSCATALRYSSLAYLLLMSWILFRFRQTPLLKQTMWKKHSESLLYVTRNHTWMIRLVRPWYLFCSLILLLLHSVLDNANNDLQTIFF